MNHIYRVIFNRVLGCWQAVTELAKSSGKMGGSVKRNIKRNTKRHTAKLAALAAMAASTGGLAGQASAQNAPAPGQLPQGGNVTAGQANINQSGNVMNIDQATQKAIINWQEFNVGKDATVNFNQPGRDAATLNRVLDANPSQIFGQIVAPGQVILINPNGAYFAPSASVDVGGLIATTHELADQDFLNGNYQFKRNGAQGKIINEGKLKAKLDGYIALMAPEVKNQGVIIAERGTVALASGEHIQLDFGTGNKLQGITVTEQDLDAQIENKHAIIAEGGLVILSARATAELRASVIKNSGQIVASAGANTVTQKGGQIILEGNEIQVTEGSELLATGPKGGGEIMIGGDWQGGANKERRVFDNPDQIHQATKVTVEANTKIDASATDNGDGGTVVVWSDVKNPKSVTTVRGEILARGGENGGDGGQIETSGRQLIVDGVSVSTLAADGSAGDWLLDPGNIEIRKDSGVTSITPSYVAPNSPTVIQTSAVVTALGSSNVTITTGTGGNYSLNVYDPIEYTGSDERTLTLGSTATLVVRAGADITSTNAPLNLVLASEIDRDSSANFLESGYGVAVNSTVRTNGGDIWIGGGELTGSWLGHTVGVGAAMGGAANQIGAEFGGSEDLGGASISTEGGAVRVVGTSAGISDVGIAAYLFDATINAGSGNIELITDRVNFDYQNRKEIQLTLEGTGTLSIVPYGNAFQRGFTWDSTKDSGYYTSTGGPDTFQGLKIQDTRALTIGKASSPTNANLNVTTDIAIDGPLLIYAGQINLDANLDTTSAGAEGDILLRTAIDIRMNAGHTITTDGGDVTFWADFDVSGSEDVAGGTIFVGSGASIDTGTAGGNIVLAGGADDGENGGVAGDGVPDGYAIGAVASPKHGLSSTVGGHRDGLVLDGASLTAGTGNVIIRGQGTGNNVNYQMGTRLYGGSISGADITIVGIGSKRGASSSNWGLSLEGFHITGTGAINLTGIGGRAGTLHYDTNQFGIRIAEAADNKSRDSLVSATGSGTIAITGDGGGGENMKTNFTNHNLHGINIEGGQGTVLKTESGAITLTGKSGYNDYGAAVVIRSRIESGGEINIVGQRNPDKPDSTASKSAEIYIGAAMSATSGGATPNYFDVSLESPGYVSQGAPITGDNLVLSETGTFVLTNTSNSLASISGGSNDKKLGSVSFVNKGALTIGNQTGLIASGDISIATQLGDITVSQSISTESTSLNAIVLNAGKTKAAGDATGGNIVASVVSGSPSVTTGTGGRALLYAGSIAGSSGLAESATDEANGLVSFGSGNFRYNADETTDFSGASWTDLEESGIYAIYREQPSVSGTITTETKTYGDEIPAYSISGGTDPVNGDTAIVAVQSPSYSSSNKLEVGTYDVIQTNLAGLGYNVSGINPGKLTVSKKSLDITSLTAGNRVYDGTTNATLTGTASLTAGSTSSSDGLYVSGDTVSLTGTAVGTFDTKTAGTNKTVTVSGLSLTGADAANYDLNAYELGANIDKALLTVFANDDAKFVTQDDPEGYAGVRYVGFVNGETESVLGGTLSITRTNSSVNTAGEYDGVLKATGLTSDNYQFVYAGGDFTIVPSNQLLVRVNDVSNTYGTDTQYEIASVEYEYQDTVYKLGTSDVPDSIVSIDSDNLVSIIDGASGTASFTLAAQSPETSTAGKLNVGSYQLGVSGTVTENSDNFSGTITVVGSHQVNAKALTALASNISKVYDGTTDMTGLSLALDGVEDNAGTKDEVTVSGSGSFSQKNVGTNLAYSINNLVLEGTDASNYYLSGDATLTGNNGAITARTLSLAFAGVDKVYDGSTQASVRVTDNRITGDDLTITPTATFNDKNVDTNKAVSITNVALSGTDSGNYTLASNTGAAKADITAKMVSLSASKTYDGTDDLTGDVTITTGVGSETLTYTGATASSKHVATPNKYVSAITLADGSNGGLARNYQLPDMTQASSANTVTITPATLTPTISNTDVTKVYDGTDSAPAGFMPIYSFSGLVDNDTSATISNSGASYNSADVATATLISVTGLSITGITGTNGSLASDYVLDACTKTVAATITKAPLTVTANNDAKFLVQDDPEGFAGVSYSGFVNGETEEVLSGTLSLSRADNSNDAAGDYALSASGLESANYSITFANGVFTIVPSNQLLVRVEDVSDTYGTSTEYSIASAEYYLDEIQSGLEGGKVYQLGTSDVPNSSVSINSSNLVSIVDGASGTASFTLAPQSPETSTADKLAVGSYQLGISGTVTENSGNFSDTITVVGSHQVNAKALTALPSNVSKVYDGTTAMSGVTLALEGVEKNGSGTDDQVSLSGSGSFAQKNAGTNLAYTINDLVLAGADAKNYVLLGQTSLSGDNGVITAATLNLSFTGINKVYDGSADASVRVTDDRISGDDLTISPTAAFDDKNVGTGITVSITNVALSGTDSGNYKLASTTGSTTAAITAKTVELFASKTYDGTTDLTGDVTITTGVGNETLTYSGATANSKHVADANKYITAITLQNGSNGGLASNYVLPDLTQYSSKNTVKITAATLTPTISNTNVTKVYDGTDSAPAGFTPTYSFSGLVGDDTATISNSGASYNSADVGTATQITVTGLSMTGINGTSGSLVSDYVLDGTTKNVAATITKKFLDIAGLAAQSRVYDGTTTAVLTGTASLTAGGASASDGRYITGDVVSLTGIKVGAFVTKDAGTDKAVSTSGLSLTGADATNYGLNTGGLTANITKALLTVTVNDDAKFLVQPDPANFAGVSYSGFVNGETESVLGGTLSITRTNSSVNTAGEYDGVLKATGLVSGNYQFAYVDGDFTIVPSEQLLVRVTDVSNTYGTDTRYEIASVEYEFQGTVYTLGDGGVIGSSVNINSSNLVEIDDGNNGEASFTLAAQSPGTSSTGQLAVGSYQLGVSGEVTENSGNFSDTITVIGSHQVNPKALTASVSDVSKVYDGNTSLPDVTFTLAGVETDGSGTDDQVSLSGSGSFAQKNVGSNLDYLFTSLALTGTDASNYRLVGGTTLSGNNGTITPRPLNLTFAGTDKVYDGNTDATVTITDNRLAGDSLTIGSSASFSDKNVGTDKTVNIGDLSLGGTDASNYMLSSNTGTTTADITRLDSVAWTGKGDGSSWFDPANWADSAVPDLSNVANVVLPEGMTVTFDNTGSSPATIADTVTNTVNIDSLGSSGSLQHLEGFLNIGNGGMTIDRYTQSGGTLTNAGITSLTTFDQSGGNYTGTGDFSAAEFNQTAGKTDLSSDLTVTNDFSQKAPGILIVDGDMFITDTSGGTTLEQVTANSNMTIATGGDLVFGDVQVGGRLDAQTTDGSITQTGPIQALEPATFHASNGVIVLLHPDNYFPSGVTLHGMSASIIGDPDEAYKTHYSWDAIEVLKARDSQENTNAGSLMATTETDERALTLALCLSVRDTEDLYCRLDP